MKQLVPYNPTRAVLGEGPVWYDGDLLWVDIETGKIHCGERAISLPEKVGCAWPCKKPGTLICALESGLYVIDLASEKLTFVGNHDSNSKATRFNDGKCDPQGRFWVGTMDKRETEAIGSLYMLNLRGEISLQWEGVTISNGLAWDSRGTTLYYIDSPTREVAAFDCDSKDGTLSNRRVVIHIPEGEGVPDGMAIDAEDKLWIALWGGWGVVRYDPATGHRLAKIELPVEQVTSCTFGGEQLDELYITTARIGLDDASLEAQPFAGGVFKLGVQTKGIAAVPFSGVI